MNDFQVLPNYQTGDSPQDLYLTVLTFANIFIKRSKVISLNIDLLKDMNPSAVELAHLMRTIADHILMVAKEDSSYESEQMSINATQCSIIMLRIADAIQESDSESVNASMQELQKHINTPIPSAI